MAKSLADVRFAPQSGHRQLVPTSPLSANRDRTQRSKIHCLFDHLVGASEQRGWHFKAERLGGLKIDCKDVLSRCLDR
jgi:hypothetical protein